MNTRTCPSDGAGRVTGGVLAGALCGVIVSALGHVISSTPAGILTAVLLSMGIGGLGAGLAGAFLGALCGVLAVGFGAVVGGSTLGVVLTILSCAFIGGTCAWCNQDRMPDEATGIGHSLVPIDAEIEAPIDQPLPFPKSPMPAVASTNRESRQAVLHIMS